MTAVEKLKAIMKILKKIDGDYRAFEKDRENGDECYYYGNETDTLELGIQYGKWKLRNRIYEAIGKKVIHDDNE